MLLSRISDGSFVEDRHEAVAELRDLLMDNPQAQIAVGSMGFPVLAEVLREDRDDVELLQGVLEVLINACGSPVSTPDGTPAKEVCCTLSASFHPPYHRSPPSFLPPPCTPRPPPFSPLPLFLPRHLRPLSSSLCIAILPCQVQAGALNSDLFARDPSNTQLLLSLLEDEPVGVNDFYVRYHTVQLLTALLSSSAYRLQVRIPFFSSLHLSFSISPFPLQSERRAEGG